MFNKKDVRKFIYDLILDGKRGITDLSQEDKEISTALIIEGHDKYSANEFIVESDSNCNLPYLLSKYMIKKDKELGQLLLDTLVENAVQYAGNTIVDLLLEQEQEYEFDLKHELKYGKSE